MDAQEVALQRPTEGQQLDALTLDEAKGILCQLGYFADTLFLSLRFTEEEFDHFQRAAATTGLTSEQFISALCEQYLRRQAAVAKHDTQAAAERFRGLEYKGMGDWQTADGDHLDDEEVNELKSELAYAYVDEHLPIEKSKK